MVGRQIEWRRLRHHEHGKEPGRGSEKHVPCGHEWAPGEVDQPGDDRLSCASENRDRKSVNRREGAATNVPGQTFGHAHVEGAIRNRSDQGEGAETS